MIWQTGISKMGVLYRKIVFLDKGEWETIDECRRTNAKGRE